MTKFDPSVIAAAQASQRDFGIPASVSLAQFALESAYGTRMPPGSNNPFGIKAVGDQQFVTASTHEVINGQSVTVQAKFRKFADFTEAFAAHAKLLATVSLYAPAMAAWKAGDLKGGVELMAKHYATDPNYAASVMSIITSQNLAQFDQASSSASAPAPAPSPAAPKPLAPSEIMRAWQQRLIDVAKAEGKPNPLPKYGADGSGGPETRAAILAFQASHPPLKQTGQLDEATRAALNPPRPPIKLNPIETALIATAIDAIIPPSPAKEFLMFNFGNIVSIVVSLLPGLPDDVNKIRSVVGELVTDANDKNGIEGLRDSARFARIIADELDKVANVLDPSGAVQPSNPIINK